MRAAIVGIEGISLSEREIALLRALPPAGVILFGRNVRDPAQLGELCAALRTVLPAGAVIAVDQEGAGSRGYGRRNGAGILRRG